MESTQYDVISFTYTHHIEEPITSPFYRKHKENSMTSMPIEPIDMVKVEKPTESNVINNGRPLLSDMQCKMDIKRYKNREKN